MKPTLQLIALFVVALLVFVGYSMAPDYVADALHLKQIGQTSMAEDMAATGDDEPNDTVNEPVDTTRQRILIFGDSMSQLLAMRLSDYTNANGHSLTCVTWNGSGTRQWAASDTLCHYMRTVHPTHVFVCLGSNELYTGDMKGCRKRVEQILAKIGNVPTTWVGPPNWMEDKGINDMLQSLLGRHRFFMTKGMQLERQADGRHPTYAAAALWMDRIVEWMNSGKAAHRFVMRKPQKRSTNYRQIVIPMNLNKTSVQTDIISADTAKTHHETMPAESLTPKEPASTPATEAATEQDTKQEHITE